MNVFIVDDEEPAREELRWLLEQCDGIEIVGEAGDAEQARTALEDLEVPPDTLFVDIDMPGIDGIRFAEYLENLSPVPLKIFVTAYEEYAVDAFGVEALDYLMKPVRLERLRTAVGRARRRLEAHRSERSSEQGREQGENDAKSAGDGEALQRISVRDGETFQVIETSEILYFESVDGEVFVETSRGRYSTEFNLKTLESKLDSAEFFRTHRSTIVRLGAIENIVPAGAGTYRLQLTETSEREGPPTAPLARSRATDLKRRIPWSASMLED